MTSSDGANTNGQSLKRSLRAFAVVPRKDSNDGGGFTRVTTKMSTKMMIWFLRFLMFTRDQLDRAAGWLTAFIDGQLKKRFER